MVFEAAETIFGGGSSNSDDMYAKLSVVVLAGEAKIVYHLGFGIGCTCLW